MALDQQARLHAFDMLVLVFFPTLLALFLTVPVFLFVLLAFSSFFLHSLSSSFLSVLFFVLRIVLPHLRLHLLGIHIAV
jgi:hypothetical protein